MATTQRMRESMAAARRVMTEHPRGGSGDELLSGDRELWLQLLAKAYRLGLDDGGRVQEHPTPSDELYLSTDIIISLRDGQPKLMAKTPAGGMVEVEVVGGKINELLGRTGPTHRDAMDELQGFAGDRR